MGFFTGKKVYITGGSSGIGRATALELVEQGAHVAISARGQDRLNETLSAMQNKRANAEQKVFAYRVDVADQEEVKANSQQVLADLGGLDVLINNAGVAYVTSIDNAEPDQYRRMMDINYFGMVWTTLAFLPHFQEQGSGSIAAVSSTLGLMGLYGYTAYAGSKYAITGFCDCLRQDLLKYNVKVSVLFPADTDTPQLHEENKIKPAETKALAGTVKVVSAEFVTQALLSGIAKGRYHIIPGAENGMVVWAHHKLPWLVRWVIDRDLRKFWKTDSQPA